MSPQKPPDRAPQLASFASLPYELRARIVKQTYYLAHMERDHALNLMLVSRDVYALVAPDWYRVVRVTRPSTLASFSQAVIAKPALGQLVTSLWLGPKDLLPQDWWPLGPLHGPDEDFEEQTIFTSLRNEHLLPRGYHPREGWSLTEADIDELSRRDKAVLEAINVAQTFLGVDLKHPRRASNGSKIGSLLWLIGVVEVQAVLDLYLLELRRLEDEASGSKPGSAEEEGEGHDAIEYPALELKGAMPPKDVGEGKSGPFTLHRTQLLHYMAQRGGPTDYFDHPVLFARSGIKTISFTRDGRGSLSKDLFQQVEPLYSDDGNSSDAFANLSLPTLNAATPLPPDLANPLDPANFTTATAGGIVHLARLLMSLTPNVKTLFVTGVLQRVLCGKGSLLPPQALRLLCLGPLFPLADESLSPCYDGGRLRGLRRLRIRGAFLADHKRACVRAIPNITRADWDLQHSAEDVPTVIKAFKPLVDEARSGTSLHRKARRRKRRRPASEDSESPASSASSQSSPQTSADADSTSGPLQPKLFITVDSDCEEELPKHFDADAVDEWEYDASFYKRPWRVRICYSSRHGYYEASDEGEREDLASRQVMRAYGDVKLWWNLVDHYETRTRGRKAWRE